MSSLGGWTGSDRILVATSSHCPDWNESESFAWGLAKTLAFAAYNCDLIGDFQKLILLPAKSPTHPDIAAFMEGCHAVLYSDMSLPFGKEPLLKSDTVVHKLATKELLYDGKLADDVVDVAIRSTKCLNATRLSCIAEIALCCIARAAGGSASGFRVSAAFASGGIIEEPSLDEIKKYSFYDGAMHDAGVVCRERPTQACLSRHPRWSELNDASAACLDICEIWEHLGKQTVARCLSDEKFATAVVREQYKHGLEIRDRYGETTAAARGLARLSGISDGIAAYISGVPVKDIIA